MENFYLFALIFWVAIAVANYMLFRKAGQEGWLALIPIVQTWVSFKIAGINPWLCLLLLIPVANFFVGIYFLYKFVESYGFSIGGFLLMFFFSPIMTLYMGFSDSVQYRGRVYN